MNNREISLYADAIIIETLLSNELNKTADASLSNLPGMLKEYVEKNLKLDPDNKAASVISMLAPGALFFLLSSHPVLRIILAVAAGTFQIEIKDMIATILNAIKPNLASGKQVTSAQVDQAAEAAGADQSSTEPDDFSLSNDGLNLTSFKHQLKNARKFKLALIAYTNDNKEFQFSKYAQKAQITKAITRTMLGRILGWIFKTILVSAGFLYLGSAIREHVLDKPKKEQETMQSKPLIVSKQTKFKLNPNYNDKIPESIKMLATQSSIEDMLVNFAKEVYMGLENADAAIRSSVGFGLVRDSILENNASNLGFNMVMMPKIFTSKKQIVDTFIDQVAKNSP